jgi:hypothetical protein
VNLNDEWACALPVPPSTQLPLHCDACGIADLDPDAARASRYVLFDLLRHDALGAKAASVREDETAILGDVFVE